MPFNYNKNGIYMLNCRFDQMFSTNYSSILYISNITGIKLLIEYCTFHTCQSNNFNFGGAIFFQSDSCILNINCVNNCSSQYNIQSYGQFAYIKSLNLNFFLTLSIQNCFLNYLNSLTFESYRLNGGNQISKYINSSFNFNYRYSGFRHTHSNNSTVIFSLISHNRVLNSNCFEFTSCNNSKISFTNIINNTSPLGHSIILSSVSTMIVEKCILINNFNQLFSTWGGGIMNVYNCWIQHNLNFISTTNIYLYSTFSLTNTFKFSFFFTLNCNPSLIYSNLKFKKIYQILILNLSFLFFFFF